MVNIGFKEIIDVIFGVGLFLNAMLFVPQAIRIFSKKESRDLSLTTFLGFCAIQLIAILYGYLHKDWILSFGYLLSLFTCGTTTFLIILYRSKNNKV